MGELLSFALYYQKMGFFVLPIYGIKNGICSCHYSTCPSPGKHPILKNGLHGSSNSIETIENWWKHKHPESNIAIRTGEISNISVLDIDPRNDSQNGLALLQENLPNTLQCLSGGNGQHLYFKYNKLVSSNKNNFLPGLDFKSNNGMIIAPPSRHHSQRIYHWKNGIPHKKEIIDIPQWLIDKINIPQKENNALSSSSLLITEGGRNNYLTTLAGTMRRKGASAEAISVAILKENEIKCSPQLSTKEVLSISKSISQYRPALKSEPLLVDEKAFSGPIGDIVKKIFPHTESSKEALLLQLLTAVGNIYGDKCFYQVESTKLFTNLFCVIVGQSSWSRKGTSWNHIERIVKEEVCEHQSFADTQWIKGGIQSGLSSGEGLLFHLRDADEKTTQDKRVLLLEAEFSSLLKKITREGNVISQVIREAWDSKNLSIMTKNNPIHVSSPHISMIGHITEQELKKFLSTIEIFNGFANRFLWTYSSRSKLLPFGGNIHEVSFQEDLKKLISGKKIEGRIIFNHDTRKIWEEVYYDLSRERGDPIIDNISSRAPAQILKISSIYALSDQRNIIIPEDLIAAKSIWDFSEKTSLKIFSHTKENSIAHKILKHLSTSNKQLTRTQIRDLFNRNAKKEEIEFAKEYLIKKDLIKIDRNGSIETWMMNTDQQDLRH